MTPLRVEPLTREAFAPFGTVIETAGAESFPINQGTTTRFHALAEADPGPDGRVILSIFRGTRQPDPIEIRMLERHPLGSQAFVPMCLCSFLVIVAPDEDGTPGRPLAFLTAPGQAINFHKSTWHGVLTPLYDPGLFAVIDRIGEGPNLEEYWLPDEVIIATS